LHVGDAYYWYWWDPIGTLGEFRLIKKGEVKRGQLRFTFDRSLAPGRTVSFSVKEPDQSALYVERTYDEGLLTIETVSLCEFAP
jgi:hypothetical protein